MRKRVLCVSAYRVIEHVNLICKGAVFRVHGITIRIYLYSIYLWYRYCSFFIVENSVFYEVSKTYTDVPVMGDISRRIVYQKNLSHVYGEELIKTNAFPISRTWSEKKIAQLPKDIINPPGGRLNKKYPIKLTLAWLIRRDCSLR